MILVTIDGRRFDVQDTDDHGQWTWNEAMLLSDPNGLRLPTAYEQDVIWANRHKIGGLKPEFYWSSEDIETFQPGFAKGKNFGDGAIQFRQKGSRARVRTVRTLSSDRIDVANRVKNDIEVRIGQGVAEYGERLQTHNGRDALQDAYEEALDLAMYLKQALLEAEE